LNGKTCSLLQQLVFTTVLDRPPG